MANKLMLYFFLFFLRKMRFGYFSKWTTGILLRVLEICFNGFCVSRMSLFDMRLHHFLHNLYVGLVFLPPPPECFRKNFFKSLRFDCFPSSFPGENGVSEEEIAVGAVSCLHKPVLLQRGRGNCFICLSERNGGKKRWRRRKVEGKD